MRLLDNFATQNGGGFFGYAGTVRATGGEAPGNAAAVGGGFSLLEMTEAVLTEIELANSRPGVSNFAAAPADATAIDIFARDVGDDGRLREGGGALSARLAHLPPQRRRRRRGGGGARRRASGLRRRG